MTHRMAKKELTYRTWEHEAEEVGTFSVASEEVLKSRTIKKARRRNVAFEPDKVEGGGGGGGAFKDFKGLIASPGGRGFTGGKPLEGLTKGTFTPRASPCTVPRPAAEPIAASVPTTRVDEKLSEPKVKVGSQQPSPSGLASGKACAVNVYYKQLAGLNCSVRDWIVKHVNANPFCDLTPVFQQYEKYLATIAKQFEGGGGGGHPEGEAAKILLDMQPPLLPGSEKLQQGSTLLLRGHLPEVASLKMNFVSERLGDAASSTPLNVGERSDGPMLGPFSPGALPAFSLSPENTCPFGKDTHQRRPVSSPASAKALFESRAEGCSDGCKDGDEEKVEPSKAVPTKVREDAFYSKKCKLFHKKGKDFKEKGAGTLHLKPAANQKTQLLVLADNKLSNVLLNILIPPNMSCTRKGKNGVVIVCVPNPPLDEKNASDPVTMLIRVKTSKDAEGLHKILLEKKNA